MVRMMTSGMGKPSVSIGLLLSVVAAAVADSNSPYHWNTQEVKRYIIRYLSMALRGSPNMIVLIMTRFLPAKIALMTQIMREA